MARTKKRKYGNELDEPLNPFVYQVGGIGSLQTIDEASKNINDELIRRLKLLLNFYGLKDEKSPDCWMTLSLCLAMEYIDGFKLGKFKKSKKISGMEAYLFYIAITEIMIKYKISIEKSIELFIKEEEPKYKNKKFEYKEDLKREFLKIKKENKLIVFFKTVCNNISKSKNLSHYSNIYYWVQTSISDYKKIAYVYMLKNKN